MYRITWDAAKIIFELWSCARMAGDPHVDGFTGWNCKKDLLKVKYELDSMLKDLPTYADESTYIQELEKQQVWRSLNQR